MIYAHVTDEGLKLLEKELKSTKDAEWYRRLKIVQLSSQGEEVPQLAKQFDMCWTAPPIPDNELRQCH